MQRGLRLYLVTSGSVLLVAGLIALVLISSLGSAEQKTIKVEAVKTLLQLVLVGLVGGLVTWLLSETAKERERADQRLDRAREEQARAHERLMEQLRERNNFRRDIITRLVEDTNVVRKAPLLILSHQSKKTYGEQVRALLDVRLDLSVLRHEIRTAEPKIAETISSSIKTMEGYLQGIVAEWLDVYGRLPNPPGDAWSTIQALPRLKDLCVGDRSTDFYNQYLLGYQKGISLLRHEILAGDSGAPPVDRVIS